MKLSGKIIAVSGSPSSGKTLTAVKIAKALADFKRQVILVCCDEQVPAIPLLIPESDESAPSLGSLLRLSEPFPITVLRHCIPFGKSGLIGLLGYRIGDQSPPQDVGEKGSKLFSVLRSCADYTVIDCGPENSLASPAFGACDIRFRLFNAGLKSFVFFEANKKEEGII
jgi:Mrp family chromosome partitioning ATPase